MARIPFELTGKSVYVAGHRGMVQIAAIPVHGRVASRGARQRKWMLAALHQMLDDDPPTRPLPPITRLVAA